MYSVWTCETYRSVNMLKYLLRVLDLFEALASLRLKAVRIFLASLAVSGGYNVDSKRRLRGSRRPQKATWSWALTGWRTYRPLFLSRLLYSKDSIAIWELLELPRLSSHVAFSSCVSLSCCPHWISMNTHSRFLCLCIHRWVTFNPCTLTLSVSQTKISIGSPCSRGPFRH